MQFEAYLTSLQCVNRVLIVFPIKLGCQRGLIGCCTPLCNGRWKACPEHHFKGLHNFSQHTTFAPHLPTIFFTILFTCKMPCKINSKHN